MDPCGCRQADLERMKDYQKELKEIKSRVTARPYLFEQVSQVLLKFKIYSFLNNSTYFNNYTIYTFRKMPRIMLNVDIRILWNKQVWMKISWDQRENQARTMTLWMRIITALKAKPRRGMETHEWWGFKISVSIFFVQWICVMIITEQNKSVQCKDLTVC